MNAEHDLARLSCTCRRCQLQWNQDYEVTEWIDSDGSAVLWYTRNGTHVPSPYRFGMACPGCGGLRVDVVPRTHTAPASPEVARPSAHAPVPHPGVTGGRQHPALDRRYGPPFPAC